MSRYAARLVNWNNLRLIERQASLPQAVHDNPSCLHLAEAFLKHQGPELSFVGSAGRLSSSAS